MKAWLEENLAVLIVFTMFFAFAVFFTKTVVDYKYAAAVLEAETNRIKAGEGHKLKFGITKEKE